MNGVVVRHYGVCDYARVHVCVKEKPCLHFFAAILFALAIIKPTRTFLFNIPPSFIFFRSPDDVQPLISNHIMLQHLVVCIFEKHWLPQNTKTI